jgi:hypothetical protein
MPKGEEIISLECFGIIFPASLRPISVDFSLVKQEKIPVKRKKKQRILITITEVFFIFL